MDTPSPLSRIQFSEHACPMGDRCPYWKAVEKLITDVYYGDGKENPSVTTRLSLLEEAVKRFASNSNKAFWMGLATLLSALGALLMLIIRGK